MTLASLGWSHHFMVQLDDDSGTPARISAIARDRVFALSPEGVMTLITPPDQSTGTFAVGDWVLTDGTRVLRLLDRQTLLQRRAAGSEDRRQLLAANVDTLGIVTSCNADFNPARLERYLAMAQSAGCLPLVILTKGDLAEDPSSYARTAEQLSPLVVSVIVDARAPEAATQLAPWTKPGQTLALMGSSGVGKTTLTNTLTGGDAAVQGIREDDAKGRHTTTARSLVPVAGGGWLIDTPGIREVGLSDAAEGIAEVFSDIEDLAATCRFRDCAHASEPGCAVQAAVAAGTLEPDRLLRWQKLLREDSYSAETPYQTRARNKATARLHASIQHSKKQRRTKDT